MATELLQIDPPQLTFALELKKQSSCVVHLTNNASHHVAFKVKTTSPNKYCVRPTVGIIKPHGTCDFTVTMQAQRTTPPDLHCKDKFLVQSALVPLGTTEDHISDLFVKDSGRHVEEKKLRVVLISPPSSPVNGDLKQNLPNQMPPPLTVQKSPEAAQDMEDDGADKRTVPRSVKKMGDMKQVNDVMKLSSAKDSEDLKSRLSIMDAKLREAEGTIMKLNEERRRNTREKDLLKQELYCDIDWRHKPEEVSVEYFISLLLERNEMLKKKIKMKRAQEGFPLLFVCVVSLVSMAVGYYIHP